MNKRIIELDMMRGLSILAVVLIHTSSLSLSLIDNVTPTSYYNLFVNQVARFAVPVFIFLSGIGLALTYNGGYFQFLYKRLLKILPYYLIWTFIYLLTYASIDNKTLSLLVIIKSIIGGSASYHLYFVPLIIQFYLLFPILYRHFRKTKWMIFALFLNMIILVIHRYVEIAQVFTHILDMKNILNWIFYFVFGVWCAERIDSLIIKAKSYIVLVNLLLVVTIVLMTTEAVYFFLYQSNYAKYLSTLRPIVFIYTLLFLSLCCGIKWKHRFIVKPLEFLSKHSFGIYLSHALILDLLTRWFISTEINNILLYSITIPFIVTVISYICDMVWNHITGILKNKKITY